MLSQAVAEITNHQRLGFRISFASRPVAFLRCGTGNLLNLRSLTTVLNRLCWIFSRAKRDKYCQYVDVCDGCLGNFMGDADLTKWTQALSWSLAAEEVISQVDARQMSCKAYPFEQNPVFSQLAVCDSEPKKRPWAYSPRPWFCQGPGRAR